MTAVLVAVMAFAVAAAARLADRTETHSPQSEPRHSMSPSDRERFARAGRLQRQPENPSKPQMPV
jgi:hypothetical protein